MNTLYKKVQEDLPNGPTDRQTDIMQREVTFPIRKKASYITHHNKPAQAAAAAAPPQLFMLLFLNINEFFKIYIRG